MSSYAYDGYKAYCQRKLLQAFSDNPSRALPPCFLEWQSARTFEGMSLPFSYPMGKNQSYENNIIEIMQEKMVILLWIHVQLQQK